jgi:hypothetical protein
MTLESFNGYLRVEHIGGVLTEDGRCFLDNQNGRNPDTRSQSLVEGEYGKVVGTLAKVVVDELNQSGVRREVFDVVARRKYPRNSQNVVQ